jgi:hypothetical protein
LGEYLKVWAALLGDENEPHFAGIVKGSAVLRAAVPVGKKTSAKLRLVTAADPSSDGLSHPAKPYAQLIALMASDRLVGEVKDRGGQVLLELCPRPVAAEAKVVVHDLSTIDGVVISLAGADDTVHLRLQDFDGRVYRVTLRDLEVARKLASHFRSTAIRAQVHGSWCRGEDGTWEQQTLYLDSFDVLDEEPASEILHRLNALPGNRWATMDDADAFLEDLRSGA